MALITWNKEYSVHIKEIDNQHKQLVKIINDLHSAISSGTAEKRCGKIIADLINYTRRHFGYEETLLKSTGYPEFTVHRKGHIYLTMQVESFQNDFQAGNVVMSPQLLSFLKRWLTNHILNTDKKYSSFMNSKGFV